MRYTTIIDLSEWPALYKNANVRLVYTHLCLKCGYHDYDRDIYSRSLRALAGDCGVSLSACRNALLQLEKYKLIQRQGGLIAVRKWIADQTITARPKTAKQQAAADERARQQQEKQQREKEAAKYEQNRRELEKQGKTPFMQYYERQMELAAAGDPNAARVVEQRRSQYEQHRAAMETKGGASKTNSK